MIVQDANLALAPVLFMMIVLGVLQDNIVLRLFATIILLRHQHLHPSQQLHQRQLLYQHQCHVLKHVRVVRRRQVLVLLGRYGLDMLQGILPVVLVGLRDLSAGRAYLGQQTPLRLQLQHLEDQRLPAPRHQLDQQIRVRTAPSPVRRAPLRYVRRASERAGGVPMESR